MASPVEGTLISAAVTVALAGAVGYGIYQLVHPRRKSASSVDLGRKWFSWMAIIVSFATLPSFFRHFDANSIAIWLINLVFYGGLAFAAGWVYGKLSNVGSASVGASPAPQDVNPKLTKGTCSRCGGPIEGDVCWSCGTRL